MSPSSLIQTTADAPAFAPIGLPPRLLVPSSVAADEPPPHWIPVGTHVSVGAALNDPDSGGGRLIVSPADGTVHGVTVVRLPDSRQMHAIELHTHADAAPAEEPTRGAEPQALARTLASVSTADFSGWIDHLEHLGVVADRWTCPDLIGQLRQAASRKIDSVICSLLDSDPWLAMNRSVATADAIDVAAGVGLITRLTAAARTWAMIDQADPPESFAGLRAAAELLSRELRLAPIENDYPQPDPTLLVYAVTRRKLPPGQLPTEKGVLLLDAAAAAAIGRAVRTGLPLTRVPVVLYDQPGDAIHRLSVTPGTPLGVLFDEVNIPIAVREVYAGSPLRQRRAAATDVIAAAGELTFFIAPPQPATVAAPCTRCGWCIEGCPTRCRPAGLLEAAQRQDMDLAQRNGLSACIECGLCSYVCPSHLPILQGIRTLR